MKIIEKAEIATPAGSKRLRILHGDLAEHVRAVDMVIGSAGGSMTGAFARKGIWLPPFTTALSNRHVNIERYRCWLVGPLRDELPLHIAVFNPIFYDTLATAFRYLFDALVQLLPAGMSEESSRIKSVGMPILLAGLGGFKVQDAAPPLMRGMIHWLALGLPLDRIDFVVLDGTDATTAAEVLRREVLAYLERPIDTRPPTRYDVFLSYARADAPEATLIADALRGIRPALRVFRDVDTLRVGGMWQHDLYLALDASKRVVALLSPHYLQSQMCIEEYNIVVLRDRQDRSDVLFPVLIEPTRLHSYMQLRQYVDCCLRDTEKLVSMCQLLVRQLDSGHA